MIGKAWTNCGKGIIEHDLWIELRHGELGPGDEEEACRWLFTCYPSTWYREHWVFIYGANADDTDYISDEEYERIKQMHEQAPLDEERRRRR